MQGQALYDNWVGGKLISIDASPSWAASIQYCLPKYLKDICQVVHGPLIEAKMYGVNVWQHQNIPAGIAPNFVYLDGPLLTNERQVAGDLLYMEPFFPPDFFLVIDDRKTNTEFLRKHCTRRYKFDGRKYRGTNPAFELIG